jgi:hypothetical protein
MKAGGVIASIARNPGGFGVIAAKGIPTKDGRLKTPRFLAGLGMTLLYQ